MLIPKPQVNIVSRVITAQSGELLRAFFALVNINGRVEVRFLGTKPLEAEMDVREAPLALLENCCEQTFGESTISSIQEVVSPFFSLDFLVNQLARAPSAN